MCNITGTHRASQPSCAINTTVQYNMYYVNAEVNSRNQQQYRTHVVETFPQSIEIEPLDFINDIEIAKDEKSKYLELNVDRFMFLGRFIQIHFALNYLLSYFYYVDSLTHETSVHLSY